MPVTLPLEVYEALERGLGKDDARTVVKSLEITISDVTEYKWATTKEEILTGFRTEIDSFRNEVRAEIDSFKNEVRAEIAGIRREFVTKELFEERINALRTDLEGKIENVRIDLEGKIENEILRLDRKFTIMFIVLFFTIVFLNQNALEFLARILGLIK